MIIEQPEIKFDTMMTIQICSVICIERRHGEGTDDINRLQEKHSFNFVVLFRDNFLLLKSERKWQGCSAESVGSRK